jgi:hypothetical protein
MSIFLTEYKPVTTIRNDPPQGFAFVRDQRVMESRRALLNLEVRK